MTYFCRCFICGSQLTCCGHREPDLISWWRRLDAAARVGARERHLEDVSPHPVTIERAQPVSERFLSQRKFSFGAVADRQAVR